MTDLDRLAEMVEAGQPSETERSCPAGSVHPPGCVACSLCGYQADAHAGALYAVAPELIAVARDALDDGDICAEHDDERTWGCDTCDALARIDALKTRLAEVLGE